MADERIHRYLGGADRLNPAPDGDEFEFDEADIWNVGEIILPESSKTATSVSRTLRLPSRRRVDMDPSAGGSKSLPLNIPNWSKIECRSRCNDGESADREGEEEGTGSGDRIAPHEYLARTRVASMSVQQGIGRTLKGRDLSNLRNAVLKKTGIED